MGIFPLHSLRFLVLRFLGYPFQGGNKRTGSWLPRTDFPTSLLAFFLANEYLRGMRIPG